MVKDTIRGILLLFAVPLLTGLVSLLALVLVGRWDEQHLQKLPRWWARMICRLAGVEVELRGGEQLSGDLPYIFAANHQSQFDIFVLQAYLGFDFRWMAKQELFDIPIFGRAMLKAGYIPVDRGQGRKALKSLNQAASRIANGTSVIIFPEGTRSPDGKLKAFKAGVMLLAIKSGVQVVPVAISGTHKVLAKGRLLAKSGKVTISVGEAIDASGFSLKQKEELAGLLESKVAEMLADTDN